MFEHIHLTKVKNNVCLQGLSLKKIIFETLSGKLEVLLKNNLYQLNFPSRIPLKTSLPQIIKNSISIQPKVVLKSRDYILVYESESDIKNIIVDKNILDQIKKFSQLFSQVKLVVSTGKFACLFRLQEGI